MHFERITLEGRFQSGAAGVQTDGRHGMTSVRGGMPWPLP
jgi:hypothetical protein